MRTCLTILAYIASLIVVGALALVLVLILAGPHADILPGWLAPVVLLFGWLLVFALPLLIARKVWQRLAGTAKARETGSSLPG